MKNDSQTLATTIEIVRRPNETIAIAPKNGRITLVTRRLFNAMLYCSQLDGVRDTYERPLARILELTDFTSSNTQPLKEQLRSMQSNQVEWHSQTDEQTRWGVSGMIAQAEIVEQRGRPTTLVWSLPPKIRDRLLDPAFYTRLSLQIHSSLRSGASVALYEICSRYTTNPSCVTMRAHWEWWRPRLTGNPESETNNEYKYFKRDVLKLALAEINAVSDLTIALVEFKNGKRIEEIQFKVQRKESVLATTDREVDTVLLEAIIRLGIKQEEARAFYAEHDADFLTKTVALTEQRASEPSAPALKSKAAYFRSAIKGRYTNAQKGTKTAAVAFKSMNFIQESSDTKKERREAAFTAHRHKQAYGHYKELDPNEQTALVDAFRQHTTVALYRDEIKKRGVASAAVRSAFCEWHATALWGPATDAELMAFLLTDNALA